MQREFGAQQRERFYVTGYDVAPSTGEVASGVVNDHGRGRGEHLRCTCMLLDGETQLVRSWKQAAAAFRMLIYRERVLPKSQTQNEFDAFIPHCGSLTRWIARIIRFVL